MADVNKSIAINYTADTSKLEKALKRIPQATNKQGSAAVSNLEANFRKMSAAATKAAKRINAKMKSIGKGMGRVGAATAAVGVGAVALGQQFADLTNELTDASTKTGIAIDTLAGLRLAAEGSGLQFSNLESGLIKFQGSMDGAARGSKNLSDTFEKLGVDVTTSTGELRSADDVFNEVVESLGAIENSTERNSQAMLLFGRSAGPALIQSGALDNLEGMKTLAGEFGIAIDEQGVQGMARFQRSMASLKTVGLGTMQTLIDQIAGGSGGKGLADGLDFVTRQIIFFGSVGGDVVSVLGQGFESLFGVIQAAALALSGDVDLAKQLINDLDRDQDQAFSNLASSFERAEQAVQRFNDVSSASVVPQTNRSISQTADQATEAVETLSDALDGVTISDELADKMSAFSKQINDDLRTPVDDVNDRFVEMKKELDDIEGKLNDEFDALINLAVAGQTLTDTQTERMLKLSEQIANVEQLQTDNLNRHMRDREALRNEAHQAELDRKELERQLEQQLHDEQLEQLQTRIDQIDMFGSLAIDTFKHIAKAISDVNQAEIDAIREQTDANIQEIDELQQRGAISAEEASKRRSQAEESFQANTQKFRERSFKANQAAAIADIIFNGAVAATKALADYGIPAGLVVAGLTAAATTAQIVSVKSQQPPKFDVGGMVGANDPQTPDRVRADLLTGEAVLDRQTVRNIGGEQGVRNLQRNGGGDRVIVIQPFKHFDRFVKGSGIGMTPSATGIRGY